MKTLKERVQGLEDHMRAHKSRLDRHSAAIMDELMPDIEKIQRQLHNIIVSNDRFLELERAVADIAIAVYDQRTKKADKRTTRKN